MGTTDLLNRDELALLAELTREGVDGHAVDEVRQLPMDIPFGNLLVPMLDAADGLHLVARYRQHQLRFPVRLARDEFNRLSLQIDAPVILENGPTTRDWRLHPRESLRVLDVRGEDTGLCIHDLSVSGLVLTFSQEQAVPELFHLQLELPDGERVPMAAQRVRRLDGLRVAYRLVGKPAEPFEHLRWFLFRQHQALNDEAAIAAAS